MPQRVNIPTYHSRDLVVLVASMLPMAVVTNYILWGEDYLADVAHFMTATITTFLYLGVGFISYGLVAISLRNRLPDEGDTLKRLAICLSIFFLMSAVYMSLLLLAYDYFNFFGYKYYEADCLKGYPMLVVMNIFLTFLNEGLYRFETFRTTVTETELLKKEYMQSQLLGLKSQMNPHFLFNSLNTLSSLIQEDADQAEEFLDHMSKVYRYLLRNHEEQLVTIETELGFIKSYYYLLAARHTEAFHLKVDISRDYYDFMVPPLTFQMIIENTIQNNAVSKQNPLRMTISVKDEYLQIDHNVQPKIRNHN